MLSMNSHALGMSDKGFGIWVGTIVNNTSSKENLSTSKKSSPILSFLLL